MEIIGEGGRKSAGQQVGLVQHRERAVGQRFELRWKVRFRRMCVHQPDDEVRDAGGGEAAADAFLLDRPLSLANAGGVGDDDGQAFKVEADLDHVAGGAGLGRDDSRVAARQRIEKA